ncbi:unnamed protein product [Prunus armeniaca]|uniref:Uncharacterized protein n=1 Tax=Prunus armeniaca TaxID=36596 RepID=A0A6J5VDB1_PRUAR|nr:unnamed protein product [Prunus armeniaca]
MEFSSCLTRGSSLRHSPATPSSSLRITKIGTSKVPISSFRVNKWQRSWSLVEGGRLGMGGGGQRWWWVVVG